MRHRDRNAKRGGLGAVGTIDDIAIEQVAVAPRHRCRIHGEAELGHHLGGRALDGVAADDRGNCHDRRVAICDRFTHAGDGENRLDADERIGRADHDRTQARIAQRRERVGLRARRGRAFIGQLHHRRRAAAVHEVILEVEPAFAGAQARAHLVVAHRNDARGNSQAAAEVGSDVGERFARCTSSRALHMGREVAVAELKPGLAAQRRQRGHKAPGLVTPAPAALRIVEASQHIHDGIEIGRDREPEMLEVVTGIGDHHEIGGAHHTA